jgi:hypothetical protein
MSSDFETQDLSPSEQEFIREPFGFLERPSFLLRVANAVGRPVEIALNALPLKSQEIIHRATESALQKGLSLVTRTLPSAKPQTNLADTLKRTKLTGRLHSLATFGLGAAGGLFGFASLPVELPLTTSVILRSIASTANDFGMDLADPNVQLECLYILSLGTAHEGEPHSSAYWTSRAIFAKMIRDALETKSAPIMLKFLTAVASKFEVVVSEKVAAEALPVIGAVGGGVINAAFTEYFSQAARFHFGLRALENRHGRESIENYYHKQ